MCFRIACKGYKVAGVSGGLGWSLSSRPKGRLYYAFGSKADPLVPIGEKSRQATHNQLNTAFLDIGESHCLELCRHLLGSRVRSLGYRNYSFEISEKN